MTDFGFGFDGDIEDVTETLEDLRENAAGGGTWFVGTDDPTGARSPGSADGTPGSGTDSGPVGGSDSMTDDPNDPDYDVGAIQERLDDKDETISSLESDLEEKKAELEEKNDQIEDSTAARMAAAPTHPLT